MNDKKKLNFVSADFFFFLLSIFAFKCVFVCVLPSKRFYDYENKEEEM